MRVLVLSPSVPLPGQPGSPRTYQLARELSQRHELSLLLVEQGPGLRGSTAADQAKSPFISQRVIRLDASEALIPRKLLNAAFQQPWFATRFKHPREHAEVVQEVARSARECDVVWADGLQMVQYAQGCDVPIVLDLVDLMSRLKYAQARSAEGRLERLVDTWRARTMRRYEAGLAGRVEAVVLNSPVDADAMLQDVHVQAGVITNGCDTRFFAPIPGAERLAGHPALLFVGNYNYQPNLDAARYISETLAPLLARTFPEVTVYLAGPPPEGGFPWEIPACVTAAGFVTDTREYYARTDAFICPLRFGAGVKNKILEAAAMGCPIVASEVAMEGLAFEDGLHFLRADAPDEFVAQVARILEGGGALGKDMATRGRALVESRYSWAKAASELEQLLVSAAT